MKRTKIRTMLFSMVGLALVSLSSCSSDNDSEEGNTQTTAHHFIYAANADNGYNITTFKDFTDGTVSTFSNAKTMVSGHLSLKKHGKYVFAISGNVVGSGMGEQTLHRYTIDANGQMTDEKTLSFKNSPNVVDVVIASDTKAYASTNGHKGELIIFNPETLEQTGEIDLSSYAAIDDNHTVTDGDPDMGNGIIVNGYLYLPLTQFYGGMMSFQPLDVDGQIAVINISTDKVEKIISTDKVQMLGMIGHTEPVVDGQYIYFNSGPMSAMFGMKDGIVRVNTTTRDFDRDYSISLQSINGGEKGSYCMQMIGNGNGKLYFFLQKPSLVVVQDESDPQYYVKNKNFLPYELDVNTKNGKILDMPASSGWAAQAMVKVGNYIYFGEHATNGTGFYKYDMTTGVCNATPSVVTPAGPYKVISLDTNND